ncbi:Uncharacterised protein [uncultured archaeon]|nr:Uncharacterised protein [uncultured archaeon]
MAKDCRVSIDITATIVILITTLLAVSSAVSASIEKMSVEDLTKEADIILIGNIVDVQSKWGIQRDKIYTYSTVSVEKYIKGGTGEENLTIISEGGRVGELFIWVEDTPTFLKDQTVLVFLKKSGKEYSVVGLSQGEYTLKNGVLTGQNGGEEIKLKDFLSQIESVVPQQESSMQTKTRKAPGFEMIAGLSGLIAARRMTKSVLESKGYNKFAADDELWRK